MSTKTNKLKSTKSHGCALYLPNEEVRCLKALLANLGVLTKCRLIWPSSQSDIIIQVVKSRALEHRDQYKNKTIPKLETDWRKCDASLTSAIAIRGIPYDLDKSLRSIARELHTNRAGLIISMIRDFFISHNIEISNKYRASNTRKSSDFLDKILHTEQKVLDHGFIRVMDYMGNDSSITQAARISYGSGTKQLNQDQGLINYLLRNNHTTPFEMCEIKLHIKMPIFIARQWVRHRTAHINEYSARYSILSSDFYVPDVEHICGQSKSNKQCRDYTSQHKEAQKTRESIIQQSRDAYRTYMELIGPGEDSEGGVARELARTILPVNFYTEMYWKIDLHNLMHFIALRNHPHAQFEIREYARILLDIVKVWVPMTYKAFEQYKTGSITISEDILRAIFSDTGGLDNIQKRMEANPAISKKEITEFMERINNIRNAA
jgi:thymidylate synthase (FAD)